MKKLLFDLRLLLTIVTLFLCINGNSDDNGSKGVNDVQDDAKKKDGKNSDVPLLPSSSAAGRILQKGEKITWIPKWCYEGVGGVKLPEISITSDGSLIGIIETTESGNNTIGSKLILLNTYDWKVLRIHNFPENKITQFSFVPGKNRIVLWSEKQISVKKPFELLIIDSDNGEIVAVSREIKCEISDLICSSEKIFVKPISEDNGKINIFDISDMSKQPEKRNSANTKGVFSISNDGILIALAGEKSVEYFETQTGNSAGGIVLDIDFIPEKIVFAGKNDFLVFSAYSRPAYSCIGRTLKKICDVSGKSLFYNSELNLIGLEFYIKDQIKLFKIPDLEEDSSFIPSKLPPQTKGSAVFAVYLPHHKKYAIINDYGSLALYSNSNGKWRKKIIFNAQK